MVWTKTHYSIRGKKEIKKFTDNGPDMNYWGAGFYANKITKPDIFTGNIYRLRPIRDRIGKILSSTLPRSLEIWKNPNDKEIHIIVTSSDNESFPQNLGHDILEMKDTTPDWAHTAKSIGFDIESTFQYNFALIEKITGHVLNDLVASISKNKDAGVWLQFAFQNMTDTLTSIAWNTHNAMSKSKSNDEQTKDIIASLSSDYDCHARGALIAMSIRGLVTDNHDSILSSIESVFTNVKVKADHLNVHTYPKKLILPWLESRLVCSDNAIRILAENAKMWQDARWGIGRDFVPFIILDAKELQTLVQIPDNPALPIRFMRRRLDGLPQTRMGFELDSQNYGLEKISASAIDPKYLLSHMYLIGATGSGKSSITFNLIKHLEMANLNNTYQSANIIIDIKGEDSKDIFRQCDNKSIDNVTYIDINSSEFSLNLLELPHYEPCERDTTVSNTVGHLLLILKQVYSQKQTFVQVERVLRAMLFYLYTSNDTPTLQELYSLITEIQAKPNETIQHIRDIYGKNPIPELDKAVKALAKLHKDSWTPLINRIEPFVIERYMSSRFSVQKGTIDFDKMLQPGQITIFRIPEGKTPPHAHIIAAKILIMRIWFTILSRSDTDAKITPVHLFLDEFESVCDLGTLRMILSRGRSMGLGLVLAHQNLTQISDELLGDIMGNTAIQLYGRIQGTSASQIARGIDPGNSNILAEQLTAQPNFRFTSNIMPAPGEERGIPASITISPPPKLIQKELPIIVSNRTSDSMSVESALLADFTKWKEHLTSPLPTKLEWQILVALRSSAHTLASLSLDIGEPRRDDVRLALGLLETNGLVKLERVKKSAGNPIRCTLTIKAQDVYFTPKWSDIGTAKDIPIIASAAFEHYLGFGMFVSVAMQGQRSNSELNTDLIAYDYDQKLATSIEIESSTQVKSHPEHVLYNMIKWPEMGFATCDSWSTRPRIQRLYEKVPIRLGKRVKCYIVSKDGSKVTQLKMPESPVC